MKTKKMWPASFFFRSFNYLKRYWYIQVSAVLISLFAAIARLGTPWAQKILIDDVLGQKDNNLLIPVLGLFCITIITQIGFGTLRQYLFTYVGEHCVIDLRNECFVHLRSLHLSFFHKNETGKIMSIFTSDIPIMATLYTSLIADSVKSFFEIVTALLIMLIIDWQLFLSCLPFLPLYILLSERFKKPVKNASKDVQSMNAEISHNLQESISATREIIAFNRENWDIERMHRKFRQLLILRVKQTLLISGSYGLAGIPSFFSILLLFWIGSKLIFAGELSTGILIAYSMYLRQLFIPAREFIGINNRIQNAMGATERVFNFLDNSYYQDQKFKLSQLRKPKGEVIFDHVTFAYNTDIMVLSSINLIINPGERIAIVGPSGSGKTTLAHLILNLYNPIQGKIMIDGIDIQMLSPHTIRKYIGVVFQDPFLFSTSIRENIAFGNENTDPKMIEKAARIANAHNFIMGLPRCYDTEIGERGITLSGGQKQRIAIARAVLRDPKILILDEATSSLDSESENMVFKELELLITSRTTFIIAHRLSTILNSDKIVVLDSGNIVEIGTHQELIKLKGVYYKLYLSQFKKYNENEPKINIVK